MPLTRTSPRTNGAALSAGRHSFPSAMGACASPLLLAALLLGCSTTASDPEDSGLTSLDQVSADVQADAMMDVATDAEDDLHAGDGALQDSEEPLPFDIAAIQYPFLAPDPLWEEQTYQALTLDQRIGQHLMIRLERSGEQPSTSTQERLAKFHLGGGFLSAVTGIAPGAPQTTARFLHHLQSLAIAQDGIPMFISLDQEGGVYASVNGSMGGTDSIPPMAIGFTKDPWVAYGQFRVMAKEIKAMGFNMNFAPSLDTHTQPQNGNLNTRSFGPDYDLNTLLGPAAMAAMQEQLILPTIKHFPGDGMTAGNTHHVFVTNDEPLDVLQQTLFKPFKAAVDAGATGVMTMPAKFTALDPDRSAVTSRAITTGLLRQEWGYQGLVVTDDLGMKGAQIGLAPQQLPGLEALKAGADLLLIVNTTDQELTALVDAIKAALQDGSLPEEEFAQSTMRILRLKRQYRLFETPTWPDEAQIAGVAQQVALPQDRAAVLEYARKAAVLIRNPDSPTNPIPLSRKGILCVGPSPLLADKASGWSWILQKGFCEVLKEAAPDTTVVQFLIPPMVGSITAQLQPLIESATSIVFASFQAYFDPNQVELATWLGQQREGRPLILVTQGVPFDHAAIAQWVDATLLVTGALPLSSQAAAHILFGEWEPAGTLLYDLQSLTAPR